MQDQGKLNTFYPIVKNAADLLLKCAGYLDDVDAATSTVNQYETYYAIDADVITLYLEPQLNAEYMDIFKEGRVSTNVISLTLLFGEFLIASNEALIPGQENRKYRFLIIPPHDEELLRMLTAIHRSLLQAVSSIKEEVFEKLSHAFEKYRQSFAQFGPTGNELALKEILRDCAPGLIELYNPYLSPEAALTRYAHLPETTFKRIDNYAENDFVFPLLDPARKKEDRKRADELIAHWEARLKKSLRKPYKKRPYAIRDDAEVLAIIEHVNHELHDKGKRVALITGSDYVFKAADTYYPYAANSSFSDLYLRHPQAFLSHENFFFSENPQQQKFKLEKWLNLFFPSELLAPSQSQGRVQRNVLRRIRDGENGSFDTIVQVIDRQSNDPKSVDRLLDAWKTQVVSVINRRYAGSLELAAEHGAERLAGILRTLYEDHKWTTDDLRKTIFDESLGSLSTLYSMTVWVGLWSRAARQQPKGIPALRFEPIHEVVEAYCERVIQMELESVDNEVSLERLEELYDLNKKVEALDPTLYLSHVVHALAFAAKGDWYATWTLAEIALAIVDNMDPAQRGLILGREAAYLACIARRRSAKRQDALDKAAMYLQEAYERETPGTTEEDIRFKSEGLAIEVGRYYFSHFCEGKSLDVQRVATTINALRQLVVMTKNENNERVKRWVLRQTLSYYFSLLLIARDLKWIEILPSDDDIASALEIFINVLKEDQEKGYKQKQNDDPYAYLIYNICVAVWDIDSSRRIIAKRNALEAIGNWRNSYMPYDEERLKLLKRSVTE